MQCSSSKRVRKVGFHVISSCIGYFNLDIRKSSKKFKWWDQWGEWDWCVSFLPYSSYFDTILKEFCFLHILWIRRYERNINCPSLPNWSTQTRASLKRLHGLIGEYFSQMSFWSISAIEYHKMNIFRGNHKVLIPYSDIHILQFPMTF